MAGKTETEAGAGQAQDAGTTVATLDGGEAIAAILVGSRGRGAMIWQEFF